MGRTWMAMVAVAALAAGCLQPPAAPGPGRLLPPSGDQFVETHDGCIGYLLAALVDPLRTDPFLPPGFHLRDPKHFLHGVGTGQALLLLHATVCAPTRDAPAWRDATAVLFVQPPSVPGERPPADYDLYEVEHYSPEPQVRGRLGAWGWPVANASLADESLPEARAHAFVFAADAGSAPVSGAGDDPLFRFGGPTPLPPEAVPFNPAVARIWRDTPLGLAYVDLSWPAPLGLGSGFCLFRPNSTLARLAGGSVCNVPPVGGGDLETLRMWAPQPSLVGTFATSFRAVGVLLRGVHAR